MATLTECSLDVGRVTRLLHRNKKMIHFERLQYTMSRMMPADHLRLCEIGVISLSAVSNLREILSITTFKDHRDEIKWIKPDLKSPLLAVGTNSTKASMVLT